MPNVSFALVQSGYAADDYASAESFYSKTAGLIQRAVAPESGAKPEVVAFPELTGLWLPLLSSGNSKTLTGVAASAFVKHPLSLLRSLISGRSVSSVFYHGWRSTFHAWLEPFRAAAVEHGIYVCPGSAFLPVIDWEVAVGWHDFGRDIYNTSMLLNPRGKVMGITRKVHLTRDEVLLGIKPWDKIPNDIIDTDFGKMGILICKDGFYEGMVSRLDSLGCRIVFQPSANHGEWSSPLARRPEITQEAEWLSEGLGMLLQGRENLVVGANPMSVSSVHGIAFQGKSNVYRNRSKTGESGGVADMQLELSGYTGLTALAESATDEEIVRVTMEV